MIRPVLLISESSPGYGKTTPSPHYTCSSPLPLYPGHGQRHSLYPTPPDTIYYQHTSHTSYQQTTSSASRDMTSYHKPPARRFSFSRASLPCMTTPYSTSSNSPFLRSNNLGTPNSGNSQLPTSVSGDRKQSQAFPEPQHLVS